MMLRATDIGIRTTSAIKREESVSRDDHRSTFSLLRVVDPMDEDDDENSDEDDHSQDQNDCLGEQCCRLFLDDVIYNRSNLLNCLPFTR